MFASTLSALRTRISVALLGAMFSLTAGSASAAVIVYTDQDAFRAAVNYVSTDHLDGLTGGLLAGSYAGAGYLARAVDPLGYPADEHADALFGVDNGAGGNWLGTNFATSVLSLDGLGANVAAIGGFFFGTDTDGARAPGALTLTVRDASGLFGYVFDPAAAGGFIGFGSDSAIEALSLVAQQGATPLYATIGQLDLGVVPEPGPLALLGVAALALAASRRRAPR